MESNYSWKRTDDIEIDLIDLLRRLCAQWKQIAVCALLFALLAGAYSYVRGGSAPEESAQADVTEEIELDEKEERGVEAAVRQQEEISGLEEYLDNSVLMKIDPYHKNNVVMLYRISQADGQELLGITESYLNFVQNGGAADAVLASGGWDLDKSYLTELIRAYSRSASTSPAITLTENMPLTGAVLYVEVTGLDADMTDRLAADMQSALEEYSGTVKSRAGEHELTLLSSEPGLCADSDLQTSQYNKQAVLTGYKDSLDAMTDAFSEDQMKVYQQIAGIDDGNEEDDAGEAVTASGRRFSVKYVLLGLIGGVFIYCCIYACLYLFRDTLKSTEEIKGLYTFPFYGGISLGGGRKQSDAYGQEIEQILNRVRLACRNQEIARLCVASDFSFGAQEKECVEGIVNQLKGWGIDAIVAENVSSDTTVWDMLTEIGNVLMVCKIGTTTHRMVDEEMSFFLENDIAVVGAVAFTLQK